ncbi:hypothetical protein LBMAG42_55910 [Deltaproteobacteria bacterium]|nr:hypothetical protein LBMAG42_55910 [Deltaproteobacteria bacterium]
MTLLDALEAEGRRGVPRQAKLDELRSSAAHVAVNSASVLSALRALGLPPAEAQVGDPLLVAASTTGSLWRLARPREAQPSLLRDEGARAWDVAARVAARHLPVLGTDNAAQHPPAGFVSLGPLTERVVDGPSFGASFVLAHASRWMGIPIDEDVAATATVDAEGRLHCVDHLQAKIEALRDRAPGVRRLIVARGQRRAMSEAVQSLLADAKIEVIEASTAMEVIEAGFTHREHEVWLRTHWERDPAHARRVARQLFRLTVRGRSSYSNWRAVANTAKVIASIPVVGEDAQWQATVVHAIAERHCGAAAAPLSEPPEGGSVPRPLRLELMAHEIQAANDRCDGTWERLVRAALATVSEPGDCHAEDLKVLGAAGRCLAGWGRWDEARGCLHRAIDGWYQLDEGAEASYAASELVRVEGLSGSLASLAAAVELAKAFWNDWRTSDMSRAYFAFAEGRAWVTLGEPDKGLLALAQAPPDALHDNPDLATSFARWRRRAGEAVGRETFAPKTAMDVLVRIEEGEFDAVGDFDPVDRAEWDRCRKVDPEGGVARWLVMFPY